MKSDIDVMFDNFVANHDEMLAQAAEADGGHLSSRKHTPIEARELDLEPGLDDQER